MITRPQLASSVNKRAWHDRNADDNVPTCLQERVILEQDCSAVPQMNVIHAMPQAHPTTCGIQCTSKCHPSEKAPASISTAVRSCPANANTARTWRPQGRYLNETPVSVNPCRALLRLKTGDFRQCWSSSEVRRHHLRLCWTTRLPPV